MMACMSDEDPLLKSVILTGATGSGKSSLALTLAEELNGELIAMDSMTLYKSMDIGTAKPTLAEQGRVRHHLLDLLEPWEAGNVAWWLEHATAACREILARGKLPIFVGGTPLYLKALFHGLAPAPPADLAVRQQWEAFAKEQGSEALHLELRRIDSLTADRLHVNDVRRVVRALEIWSLTGQPMSQQEANWEAPPRAIPAVVLDWPREQLYLRIEHRIDQMLAAGWLHEVEGLLGLAKPMSKEARQALGYRELLDFLAGGPSWEETIVLIKTHTRQFAKRQLTWFRSFNCLHWCQAASPDCSSCVKKVWQKSPF
jgi:tRNA dimethylallyltransferase